ncbi:MAG: hypothetical protein AAFU71_09090 [Cyanobacteria bacterium J06632_22]
MRSLTPALLAPLLSSSAIASSAIIATAGAASAQIPDYYVGAGVRALFNDDTAFILDSKVKVFEFGGSSQGRTPRSVGSQYTASVRPALYFGNETEYRVPITVETEFSENFYPFLGGGIAYNVDGSEDIDPMITAGLDVRLSQQLILNVEGNFIFQNNDTDAELTASINYAF